MMNSKAKANRRILYVQFTNPAHYPPVEHSALLLAKRGWRVLLLGVGRSGLEMSSHPSIIMKRMAFFEGGVRQKLQYLLYFFWTLYWTWRWQPRWIYASDPLVCPIVWWLRKIIPVKIAYHEHDSPSSTEPVTWFMQRVLAHRDKIARAVEVCILPQQTRLRKFLTRTGRTGPTFCVWNVPRLEELDELDSEVGQGHRNQNQGLVIYYHGSITPERLPRQLIVAASRFKGVVRLRIAGYEALGTVGYTAELCALAEESGAPHMIEQLGKIPTRQGLLRLASQADLGLSLMPKESKDINLRNMVGASNKPFDYMACGLPLIVTDLREWSETFVAPGYALACDPTDPDSIEVVLRWYLDHPVERLKMGQAGQQRIRESWNYDTMDASVIASLEHG